MASTENEKRAQFKPRSRDAKEILDFTLVEAHKELATNQIDQFRKLLRKREYGEWTTENLSHVSEAQKVVRKAQLLEKYPSMVAGVIANKIKDTTWQPLCIVESSERSYYGVMVYWASRTGHGGLTYLNNGLEIDRVDFESFAIEGISLNCGNLYAVGEKGHGFLLALHFLLREQCKLSDRAMRVTHAAQTNSKLSGGVEFRVGKSIGECKFGPKPKPADRQSFQIFETQMDGPGAGSYGMTAETMRGAKDDEVCITALGSFLVATTPPKVLFSGFYGVFPPDVEFKSKSITLYISHEADGDFYLRGQIVMHGKALGKVGVNYAGDFDVTSDRTGLRATQRQNGLYCDAVSRAVQEAVISNHPIVPYLIQDLMRSNTSGDHDFCDCLTVSNPAKLAIETINLWKQSINKVISTDAKDRSASEYYVTNQKSDFRLIMIADMAPHESSDRFVRLMQNFDVYPPIGQYMRSMLVSAPESTLSLPDNGIAALRKLFTDMITIKIHAAQYPEPRIAWEGNVLHFNDTTLAANVGNQNCDWMIEYLEIAWRSYECGDEPRKADSSWLDAFNLLRGSIDEEVALDEKLGATDTTDAGSDMEEADFSTLHEYDMDLDENGPLPGLVKHGRPGQTTGPLRHITGAGALRAGVVADHGYIPEARSDTTREDWEPFILGEFTDVADRRIQLLEERRMPPLEDVANTHLNRIRDLEAQVAAGKAEITAKVKYTTKIEGIVKKVALIFSENGGFLNRLDDFKSLMKLLFATTGQDADVKRESPHLGHDSSPDVVKRRRLTSPLSDNNHRAKRVCSQRIIVEPSSSSSE